ncbi:hypothetical protein NUW58_g8823 [Xylaria curta]|uniref:Uncharacterized protein n=1 Tax=Xylaria curta TaxID=42375 RepID=A0ACC1N4T7_9PEZI|nr:hypothetical protein NUW58_g8823 [Xylaria curta]
MTADDEKYDVIAITIYAVNYLTNNRHLRVLDSPWGLTWASEASLCVTTLSQGSLLLTDINNCVGETTTTVSSLAGARNTAIIVSARPILLTGRSVVATTPLPSSTYSRNPGDGPTSQGSRPDEMIGAYLGSIIGGTLFLSLAIYYIRRRSKAIAMDIIQVEEEVKARPDEYTGKPELEGSKAYVYTTKPELDATMTRAELEGGVGEFHGDGIYVLKPELEGTVGTERNRGAYVRNKSELEAVSKPGCLAAEQDPDGNPGDPGEQQNKP